MSEADAAGESAGPESSAGPASVVFVRLWAGYS